MFSLFVTEKGVSNNAQTGAMLLQVTGLGLEKNYFAINGEIGDASFEATVKVLDDYIMQRANIPFVRDWRNC